MLTSVLQDTSVTSMLCVIILWDRITALVRKDIMETDEAVQVNNPLVAKGTIVLTLTVCQVILSE